MLAHLLTPDQRSTPAPFWLPLETCGDWGPDIVGGKAHNLGRLLKQGLNVPEGVCFPVYLFRAVLQHNNLESEIRKRLDKIHENAVLTGKLLEQIRSLLHAAPLPQEAELAITKAVTPLLNGGPVVVRSSSPREDGRQHSHAGIYYPEIDLTSAAEVIQAIRRCWMSLFTDKAWFYTRGLGETDMAVIVQRQVKAKVAGVMFTRGLSGVDPYRLVELAPYSTDAVTSGKGQASRYSFGLDGTGASALDPRLKSALAEAATTSEGLVGGPADVEWAWDGDKLHYLQVRPAGRTRQCCPDSTAWFHLDDPSLWEYDLGKCQRFLIRLMQKKVWLRRFCRQAGIPTFKTLYVFYDESGLEDLGEQLVQALATEFVRIRWGDEKALCSRTHLLSTLKAGIGRNQVGTFTCAEVAEVIVPDREGFATIWKGNEVLIEAFPAKIPGIKEGSLPPTRIMVSASGEVSLGTCPAYDRIARLDPTTDRWRLETVPPYTVRLSPAEAARIAEITRLLCEQFGEVRLEWYLSNGQVFVKDLSIENQPIQVAEDGIISSGTAEGDIVILRDIRIWDEMAEAHGISVVNSEIKPDVIPSFLVGSLKRLMKPDHDHIVVAEYPSTGLIELTRWVRGFIFERGSLLCHTAIVLREKGVPAVIVPDATRRFQDGDRVLISPAGVNLLRRARDSRREGEQIT